MLINRVEHHQVVKCAVHHLLLHRRDETIVPRGGRRVGEGAQLGGVERFARHFVDVALCIWRRASTSSFKLDMKNFLLRTHDAHAQF